MPAKSHRIYPGDGSESWLPDPESIAELTDDQVALNRRGFEAAKKLIREGAQPALAEQSPTPSAAVNLELPTPADARAQTRPSPLLPPSA